MKSTKYLLIGGGLASSQAGRIIRMKDADGGILLVSKEPVLPYDRPPLSKEMLRGEKQSAELIYDPQPFFEDQRIDVTLDDAAVVMDAGAGTVELASGDRIAFEKAFIATGGDPLKLDVPGSGLGGVCYLRTMSDAQRIASAAAPGKRAVVIGAGFIGMEVAASLTQLGVDVTVIEKLPRVWPHFLDEKLAGYLEEYCTSRGIRFLTGETVKEFQGSKGVDSVLVESGDAIPCDFVCIGIGISPEVALAESAGLDVDNGIVVDEYLQTSHPRIYAGGDVANYPDPVFGKRRRVEHWGHAEYCGQLAGLNMTGAEKKYDLLTYVWSDIFDLHIECAGDETERDRTLLRGKLGDPSFVVLYLKNHVLRAYFAINASKREFPKLQRLIRQAVDLTGKDEQLSDPSFELKSLL